MTEPDVSDVPLKGTTPDSGPADLYGAFLFDLDGVVYVGPTAVPGAAECLARLRRTGGSVAFVTNNAARTPDVIADHLTGLGISAKPEDVVTSAQAAARLVCEQVPTGARILVVGGEGLQVAVRERRLEPVSSAADRPAAVVQGFHPDVGWRLLAEGAYALARGVPWVASNIDRTLPTQDGLAPGNGTLVEVLRMATGREPTVAGKPARPLMDEAVLRLAGPSAANPPARPLVVGDRLDTDIEGAKAADMDSFLVLTGVTTVADLLVAPPAWRPTYISSDLGGLFEAHAVPELAAGGFSCGGWTAEVVDHVATLEGSGTRDDGIRALAAACWSAGGPVETGAALRALV